MDQWWWKQIVKQSFKIEPATIPLHIYQLSIDSLTSDFKNIGREAILTVIEKIRTHQYSFHDEPRELKIILGSSANIQTITL